jgi:hypothetical protein
MKHEETVDLEDKAGDAKPITRPITSPQGPITKRTGLARKAPSRNIDDEDTGENTDPEFKDTSEVFPGEVVPSMFPEDTGPTPFLRNRLGPEEVSRIVALHIPKRDPFTRWYYGLPVDQRLSVYRALWMMAASFLVVATFTFCVIILYPRLSTHFLPAVGPRPKLPQVFNPPAGELYALVENRGYDRDRFIAGLDCIWVTYDPVRAPGIAKEGPYLEHHGRVIGRLEVKENWDGLLRLYFSAGDIKEEPDADLVIPLAGGGAFKLAGPAGARVLLPGAPTPDRLVVGHINFYQQ